MVAGACRSEGLVRTVSLKWCIAWLSPLLDGRNTMEVPSDLLLMKKIKSIHSTPNGSTPTGQNWEAHFFQRLNICLSTKF